LESCIEKDGDFWMAYNDWLKTFTHIEVIHLDGDTAKDEPSLLGICLFVCLSVCLFVF
jgi:hypothetical protein